MRIYDNRLGRFLSVDPITAKYPELTPYQFALKCPIFGIDLDGLEIASPQILSRRNYPVLTTFLDGLEASVNKTWNFFKPGGDAYKAYTYKQGVLFLEEAALLSSPVSDIYKPNTPKLDAIVDNMNKELLKGNTYSRTKYLSEFGTDLLTAYVGSKGLGAAGSLMTRGISISAEKILFSQSSVNELGEIVQSMKANGWIGAPVDVIKLEGGLYGTLDNTRVLAAHEAGIKVKAIVHNAGDALTAGEAKRFTTKAGTPKTCGEAYQLRIGKKNSLFKKNNPYGSYTTSAKN